jgi:hypothetical protein
MSNRYPSKYSNGKTVTAAQYITEIICENKARYDKKDLHYRFWVSKEWAAFYRNQIATANKLVKKYDPAAIVKALRDPKAQRLYSLRAPSLIAIIEKEQKLLDSQNKELKMNLERKKDIKFDRKIPTVNNILSKLKSLDEDTEEQNNGS